MSFLFRKRRSVGGGQGKGMSTPAGIQSMDESLQKKFSKGIQFNMKIIIRGDRNTGKSCLFKRMEGKPFTESYAPTDEIQVTSILWSYRVTNDTVKVEIWDIVDKGRTQKKSGKGFLKMFNNPAGEDVTDTADMPLDAEFLDVYKGAHGAVFTFDMTKQWTWKYIEKEVPKVPLHIPVMILANFRDMGEHRVVARDEVVLFIEQLSRPEGAAAVRYAECSLKNGFGLMHLHKFLSVPFLQLQQETLLQQLQVNREQMLASKDELDSAGKSEDQCYDMFLQKVQRLTDENRKRSNSQPDSASSAGGDSPGIPSRSSTLDHSQLDTPTSPVGVADEPQRSGSFSSKLTSKFSGFLSRNKEAPKKEQTSAIDNFVPEGGEVDSFLEGSEESGDEDSEEDSDEDDTDGGNPQVILDEDLSSPDEPEEVAPPIITKATPTHSPIKKQPKPLKSAKDIVLTESEEESEGSSVPEDEEDIVEHQVSSRHEDPKPEPEKKTIIFSGTALDEMFGNVPKEAAKAKKKVSPVDTPEATHTERVETMKPAKKSGGLLLEFSSPPPIKPNQEPMQPLATDSPNLGSGRKDSKRKKKSKSRKESKDTTEEVAAGGGKKGGTEPPSNVQVSANDPFGAISSLDAWLNSEATGKEGPLESSWSKHTPTKITAPKEEPDSSEEDKHKEKKSKKHRHRRHREPVEEDRERTSSRKKKHKHKSSSRHKTLEQEDADYDSL